VNTLGLVAAVLARLQHYRAEHRRSEPYRWRRFQPIQLQTLQPLEI
jgi:hypothetical protein